MQKEINSSPWWWIRNKKEIENALETLDLALEEYDEDCGFAFTDIPQKIEEIKNFFNKICYKEIGD